MEKVDLSPGVRRMLALVGSEAPFDHGRRQLELLAALKVTAKAVERTAESIGLGPSALIRGRLVRKAGYLLFDPFVISSLAKLLDELPGARLLSSGRRSVVKFT